MNLFPENGSGNGSLDDLQNPKHWFLVVGDGPYQIRNFTLGQNLLGEYDTKAAANKVIKAIASRNPRFRS